MCVLQGESTTDMFADLSLTENEKELSEKYLKERQLALDVSLKKWVFCMKKTFIALYAIRRVSPPSCFRCHYLFIWCHRSKRIELSLYVFCLTLRGNWGSRNIVHWVWNIRRAYWKNCLPRFELFGFLHFTKKSHVIMRCLLLTVLQPDAPLRLLHSITSTAVFSFSATADFCPWAKFSGFQWSVFLYYISTPFFFEQRRPEVYIAMKRFLHCLPFPRGCGPYRCFASVLLEAQSLWSGLFSIA